jgi:hypothetical protein
MKSVILNAWRALTSTTQTKAHRRRSNRPLRLEPLEDRYTPANITLAAGVVTIDGSSKDDVSFVELVANNNESIQSFDLQFVWKLHRFLRSI